MIPHSPVVKLPQYQLNQALYTRSGLKIGWVESIETGSGMACVRLALDGGGGCKSYIYKSLGDLRSGSVLTRAGLAEHGIQRVTPPSIFVGCRMFRVAENALLDIGPVIAVDVVPTTGAFMCRTAFGQALSSEDILGGHVYVGRREHPSL